MKHVYPLLLLVYLFTARTVATAQTPNRSYSLGCGYHDDQTPAHVLNLMKQLGINQAARRATGPLRECRVWVVVDSTIRAYYQADTNRIKSYLYAAYAEANLVMEREIGVHLNVVAIELLKKPTPRYNFPTRGGAEEFLQFANFRNDYLNRRDVVRDLTVLWTMYLGEPYGGVSSGAEPNGGYQHLCGPDLDSGNLLTHETGHNFGSPHTHNCTWPGGPIDVCNDPESGPCYTGVKSSNVGTIMSYCPSYGVGGSFTFHPLCRDLMTRVTTETLKYAAFSATPTQRPVAQFPANGQTSVSTGEVFSWRATPLTYRYQVVVSDKADFSTVVADTTLYGCNLIPGRTLPRNTTYYWRVRGLNPAGAGPWSVASAFRTPTVARLQKPTVARVLNRRLYEDQLLRFAPVPEASQYEIAFHRWPNTNEPLTDANLYKTIKLKTNQLRVGDWLSTATDQGQYRWRVRALTDSLTGAWSDDDGTFNAFYLFDKLSPNDMARTYNYNQLYRTPTDFRLSFRNYFSSLDDLRRARIEVSDKADFSTIIFRNEQSITLQGKPQIDSPLGLDVRGLLPDKKYYYRLTSGTRIDSATRTGEFTTGFDQRWKRLTTNSVLGGMWRGFFVDKTNNKWLFGEAGIQVIRPDGSTKAYTYESTGQQLSNQVNDVAQDAQGRMWLATSDGLVLLDNDKLTNNRRGIFGRNVGGYIWYAAFTRLMAGTNGSLVAIRDYDHVLRFDGTSWQDITGNQTFESLQLIRNDAQSGIWVYEQGKRRLSLYENGQWSQPSVAPISGNVNINYVSTDNLGRAWFRRDTAVYVLENKTARFIKNVTSVTDIITGRTYMVSLNSFLSAVQVMGTRTYFFGAGPQGFLEYDGQQYLWHSYPTVWPIFDFSYSTLGNTVFSVDTEGNPVYLDGKSELYRFRRNGFNGFSQKQTGVGCRYSFRVGIGTPPTNDTPLRLWLSDSTAATFREVSGATYKDGIVSFAMPASLRGSGFRLKYTLGDRYESSESDPFAFAPAFTTAVGGNGLLCQGSSATLTPTAAGAQGAVTYLWQTGATTPTLSVSAAGTYSFTATDANGCLVSALATLTQVPLPVATVTGRLSYCAGQTTTLSGSVVGSTPFTYQWQRGPDRLGTSLAQPVSSSGTYTLTTTDRNGCVGSSTAVSVTEEPLPTVSVAGNNWFCTGLTTTLSGSAAGGSGPYALQWQRSTETLSAAASLTVGQAGSYTLAAQGANGCVGNRSLQVREAPNPAPVVAGSASLCSGQTTPLSVSSGIGTGPFAAAWQRDQVAAGTANPLTASVAGVYVATLTDALGCVGTSARFMLIEKPTPDAQITSGAGGLYLPPGGSLLLTANNGPSLSYQWSLNGALLAGVTSVSYAALQAGTYTVSVTRDGCVATSAGAVVQLLLAVDPALPGLTLRVWPNPSSGRTTLRLTLPQANPATLTFYNETGRSVQQWLLQPATSHDIITDLRGLPAGMYLVVAEAAGQRVVQKILVE